MAKKPAAEGPDLLTLVGDIAGDAKELIGQQFDLVRAEVREGLTQAGQSAAAVAAGGGLAAAGGLLSGMTAAHLLHRLTGLPLWASYGAVGGAVGAAGVYLLRRGVTGLTTLPLLPRTADAVEENAAWLGRQITPGG